MKYSAKQYAEALYDLTKEKDKEEIKKIISKFVIELRDNNDAGLADKILWQFENVYNQKEGLQKVEITSAQKLNDSLKKQIVKIFAESTGKEIEMEENIDEALIGGFRAKVGDILLDNSVRNRLQTLKNKLK